MGKSHVHAERGAVVKKLFKSIDFWILVIALVGVALLFVIMGCRFPGVDQHEGHNYEPNPWHVPVDTNSTKL